MARTTSVMQASLATSPAQLVLLVVPGFLKTSTGWLIGLALVLVCSLLLWRANFRRARAVEDTPTSKVASAHQGYVELVGAARLGEALLVAPLTRRQCVWYRYRVEKKGSRNKWVTEQSGCSDNLFLIDDGSGMAVVDARQAEMLIDDGRQWIEGRRRYTEWIVGEGEQVYAIGDFASEGGSNSSLDRNADVGALLAQWKQRKPVLHERFDLDADGRIDEREWGLARRAAQREVERRHREILSQPVTHVLRQPADGRPFLVSTLDPVQVGRRHRLWQWLHLLFALAAGGAMLAMTTGMLPAR
jgi:hypothetical protein